MSFKIDTDYFRGPIDLLLFLVRRHELDITGVALGNITEKYLEFIDVLKEISIDMVGDFIEVASVLVEMKARAVLPRNELEQDETEYADPRDGLVVRLLMYKQFKDASLLLDDHRLQWQNRYARMANDAPRTRIDMADQPIHEVELWDLVSAFGRVLRDNRPVPQENIKYDETPIHIYMQRIHAKIVRQKSISFTELFEPGMHKSAMVGIFLAVLELTRHHNVIAQQNDLHSEILIIPSEEFAAELDVSNIDDYDPHKKNLPAGDPGSMVE
ncbi:MAG: segregation/condensation protein A [Planctomycetota bacterium]